MEVVKKAVHRLCTEVCGRRTRDMNCNSGGCDLIQTRFFPARIAKHWNRDAETDESLSLEGLRPE